MKNKITLIQILFLCVFFICGVLIGRFYYEKHKTEKEMDSLRDELAVTDIDEEYTPPEERDAAEEVPSTPEPREENGMLSRYYDLYKKNNDMIGWIKVYDTVIDYPVVHNTESNSYYLHRNFEKKNSSSGVPYLDCECDRNGECDNMIIYGHNMRNGTMFHQLLSYADKAFFDTHQYIMFDTMFYRCHYKVFAVFRTSVGSANGFKYEQFVKAKTEDEYNAFVDECVKRSIYKTGERPSYREKLLTLSTCSYSSKNERFVVMARLVEKN